MIDHIWSGDFGYILSLSSDMLLYFRKDKNGVSRLFSGLAVGDNDLEIIQKSLEAKHLSVLSAVRRRSSLT